MKKFDIYYFDIDKNFEINKNINEDIKYDLLVMTHPFGFYLDHKVINNLLKDDCKIIYDSSHSQGIKIENVHHTKFSDISFISIQGNKAISGGEGGVVLTDNQNFYLKMINSHHPGHKKNNILNTAGGINNLKLRIHPLAALLASNDLKSFRKRNFELVKKVRLIYDYFDKLKVSHPFNQKSNIGGFHYGLPFFSQNKIEGKIIRKYNWYFNLQNIGIKPISKNINEKIFHEIHFIDIEWIKRNNIYIIKDSLKKIFANDN